MIEKAVIDRFEESYAVLLIGDGKRRVNFPVQLMPQGAKEGTWLKVEFDGNELRKVEIDPEETENAKRRIAEKMERLRRGDHLK